MTESQEYIPGILTQQERDDLHRTAAEWLVREEDGVVAVEYARRQRAIALGKLGMVTEVSHD